MRILTTLTYYTPHISGLTIYATRIARGLIQRGHHVTVLTSHYGRELPLREQIDGADIIRAGVVARVGKGVLMPSYLWHIRKLVHSHDVLYLHLPQLEASFAATYARFVARKPVVTSYQCDIELPDTWSQRIFGLPIALSHHVTAMCSDQITTTSQDYADHSPFLKRYRNKTLGFYPPCPLPEPDSGSPLNLRETYSLGSGPIVGFLGRFAEDKGVQHLLDAIPAVLEAFPDARFVLAGQREKVFGERVYERLLPKIEAVQDVLVFPGQIPAGKLVEYYRSLDVFVLPSINSTESFGMVQVEAMLCGTPVVASSLPGVREPVRATGMGELATPADPRALADAIKKVLGNRDHYVKPPASIAATFDQARPVDYYERLFLRLTGQPEPVPASVR
jgi:glycosyltransferase involved in cell wall biosynthesis